MANAFGIRFSNLLAGYCKLKKGVNEMREIKFRAMMDRPHTGHEGLWVYISGIGHDQWHSKNGRYYGEIRHETKGEFTGLHDENGKEAYHHDLFVHVDRNQGKPIEIIWHDGSWRGQYVGSDFQFLLNQWELDRGEIIGNIYENKELINGI